MNDGGRGVSITLRVLRLPHGEGLPLPTYHSEHAAGLDVVAGVPEDAPVALAPGARALVPTGFAIELPAGLRGPASPALRARAEIRRDALEQPGTIDADYRGEVKVLLVNLGSEPFTVRRGSVSPSSSWGGSSMCGSRRSLSSAARRGGRAASAPPVASSLASSSSPSRGAWLQLLECPHSTRLAGACPTREV